LDIVTISSREAESRDSRDQVANAGRSKAYSGGRNRKLRLLQESIVEDYEILDKAEISDDHNPS